jgi:hypothetical protein
MAMNNYTRVLEVGSVFIASAEQHSPTVGITHPAQAMNRLPTSIYYSPSFA